MDKYLTEFFVFENPNIRDHRVGTDNELYTLAKDSFIYHSTLGAIVQAGPKTRSYYLSGKKCVGLKKLYQYINRTESKKNYQN